MMFEGCQGKPRTPTIHEKVCPRCGNIIDIFSIDTEVACDRMHLCIGALTRN